MLNNVSNKISETWFYKCDAKLLSDARKYRTSISIKLISEQVYNQIHFLSSDRAVSIYGKKHIGRY